MLDRPVYIAIPVALFAAVLIGAALVSTASVDWLSWQPASCMPDNCFCEALHDGDTYRQPANTWSSLAFVLIGLLIFAQVAYDSLYPHPTYNNILIKTPMYGLVFGMAMLVVGFGSAFYHASLSFIGQFTDVAGMYLATSFMLVYVIQRWAKWSVTTASLVYVVLNIVLAIALVVIPDTRRYLFGIVLVIALIIEGVWYWQTSPTIDVRWLLIGLVLFVAAFGIWILDINHILCDPHSLIQGHSGWHTLTAIASGLLYIYYRSQSNCA
ncbi:MAG: ceramidase domain-containing protein [Anaerolineaceae bacterium]|nr:ceramidase domain-containing protein [Anaerolineae bacterium]MCB9460981.1 ceramidase domain-containing protein [Anaerolineaceae bacterium]